MRKHNIYEIKKKLLLRENRITFHKYVETFHVCSKVSHSQKLI